MVAVAPILSMIRPGTLPGSAPRGRTARELRSDGLVTHPGYGLTPQQALSNYALAELGWPQLQNDMFDDVVESDAHLRNLLEQRENAVAGKPVSIAADGAEGESELAAEVLAWAIKRLPFMDALQEQLKFNRYGYAATEIDWDLVEYKGRLFTVPVWFASVPARRFRIDTLTDQLKILTADTQLLGEPLAAGKWWVTRRAPIRLARSGLMRTALWPALWKRFATRDWVIRCEKFGLPLLLVKYAQSTDEQAKDVAEEIIERFGDDGGAAVPQEIQVEVKESGAGDSAGTHGGMISHCNTEMSKLVNGSTLANDASDTGSASYALGDIHNEVRWEAVVWDALKIHTSFACGVAEAFLRFNAFAAETRPPVLEIQVVRDLDPTDLINMAEKLQSMGIPVSVSQLRRLTGMRAPIGEDDSATAVKVSAEQNAGDGKVTVDGTKPAGDEPSPSNRVRSALRRARSWIGGLLP